MKATAIKNLEEDSELLGILVAQDYQVTQLSLYHFRINQRLDVWPTTRKWYNHKTRQNGVYADLLTLVRGEIPTSCQ